MGCLIVDLHCSDPHCSDPMSSLPQTRFPLLTLRDLLGLSGSRVNRVLTARIENGEVSNGTVEKVLAMDGGRGAPGFRVTRGWADPSSRTTHAVQLDNRSSPHGPDGHPEPRTPSTKFCPVRGAERSTNPPGNPREACARGRGDKRGKPQATSK